jgi:glucose-1-phosphate cytidylyltransferase
MDVEKPTVVILCGGRGTRLREQTQSLPKPLVEIGGHPILWHVIQIYRAQGFSDFLLLTGYMADQIERFSEQERWPAHTSVRCLFTGVETPTGGRLKRAEAALKRGRFCATYADGVADIDLSALLSQHISSGADATVTVVRPELPFGVTELDDDGLVRGFVEKPRSDYWINGGFFCFEPAVLDLLSEDVVLEREPLERLAAGGRLRAYRHDGFWDCMDTFKDQLMLNDLWLAGEAPWKLWT